MKLSSGLQEPMKKRRCRSALYRDHVKSAMRINYFEDADLIRAQSEKYEA